jgi:hypothetical protein
LVALALAGLVGAYAALSTVRWQEPATGLAVAAFVALVAALWLRRAVVIPFAVLFLGAAYGVAVAAEDPAFDATSIIVAALLVVIAELGFWSLELATPVRYEPEILTRRLVLVAALGLGALCAAAVVGAAAAQEAERSLLLAGLGVVAAAAVLALIARLAVRRG